MAIMSMDLDSLIVRALVARDTPSDAAQTKISHRQAGRITHTAAIGIVWLTASICVTLVVARLVIHLKFARRLHWDDALAVLALVFVLSDAILTTIMAPYMYEVLKLSQGLLVPGPDFWAHAVFYLKAQFSSTLLFWTELWLVKACFLAFFWRLTYQCDGLRKFWWVVVVITALSFIGSMITYPLACSKFQATSCLAPMHVSRALISLRFSTVVDVVTDVLIMAIPLILVWRLQLNLAEKVGLVGVFSLGIITIVFSITRCLVSIPGLPQYPELSWLATFSALETGVALSVACLASFRVLFTQLRHNASRRPEMHDPRSSPLDGRSRSLPKKNFSATRSQFTSTTRNEDYVEPAHYTQRISLAERGRPESGVSEADWRDGSVPDPRDGIVVRHKVEQESMRLTRQDLERLGILPSTDMV